MALSFGVTVLPDPPYQRLVELMVTRREPAASTYGWTYDSHVLWQDSFSDPHARRDQATSTMKFGHQVTNPGTRDPTVLASLYATLHDISDGRMVMGIGRGDSALRYIGRQPVKVAEFERDLAMIKPFMNGEEVAWNEKELQLKWVRPELPEIEMWVAGYGPKALAVAGRVGDGVIIQLADPEIIQWIMGTAAGRRRGGGPRPGGAQVHRVRAEHDHRRLAVGARGDALVPGDGLEPRQGPDRALRHRRLRRPEGAHRLRRGTEVLRLQRALPRRRQARRLRDRRDLRPLLGARDVEQTTAKLRELEAIGVDQFSIYLMTHSQEETLAAYGEHIIPPFKGVPA